MSTSRSFRSGSCAARCCSSASSRVRRLLQRRLRLRDRGVGRLGAFGRDVALDFELAKIAEQRARLRGEPIGFGLQRANPFVDAARHAHRSRRVCVLARWTAR